MRDYQPTSTQHPMPFTRIELAILSVVDDDLAILLAKRAEAPHKGKWALPGGVLRIDLDHDLAAAAQRVAGERVQSRLACLRQLVAVGGKARDPRAAWGLSIVYRALLPVASFAPSAGKRIEILQWVPVDSELAKLSLAFDHAELAAMAVAATRSEIERMELPFSFLPDHFTLGELQATCEAILGRRQDKSSFRRKLDSRQVVEPVEGQMRTGAFRPAQLYHCIDGHDLDDAG